MLRMWFLPSYYDSTFSAKTRPHADELESLADYEERTTVSDGETWKLLQTSKTLPFESFNLFARTVLNVRLD
jgi:hypothetical protein